MCAEGMCAEGRACVPRLVHSEEGRVREGRMWSGGGASSNKEGPPETRNLKVIVLQSKYWQVGCAEGPAIARYGLKVSGAKI